MNTMQPGVTLRPRSARRLAAATALVTALAVPANGVGVAVAQNGPPLRVEVVAAPATAYPLVLAGKRQV